MNIFVCDSCEATKKSENLSICKSGKCLKNRILLSIFGMKRKGEDLKSDEKRRKVDKDLDDFNELVKEFRYSVKNIIMSENAIKNYSKLIPEYSRSENFDTYFESDLIIDNVDGYSTINRSKILVKHMFFIDLVNKIHNMDNEELEKAAELMIENITEYVVGNEEHTHYSMLKNWIELFIIQIRLYHKILEYGDVKNLLQELRENSDTLETIKEENYKTFENHFLQLGKIFRLEFYNMIKNFIRYIINVESINDYDPILNAIDKNMLNNNKYDCAMLFRDNEDDRENIRSYIFTLNTKNIATAIYLITLNVMASKNKNDNIRMLLEEDHANFDGNMLVQQNPRTVYASNKVHILTDAFMFFIMMYADEVGNFLPTEHREFIGQKIDSILPLGHFIFHSVTHTPYLFRFGTLPVFSYIVNNAMSQNFDPVKVTFFESEIDKRLYEALEKKTLPKELAEQNLGDTKIALNYQNSYKRYKKNPTDNLKKKATADLMKLIYFIITREECEDFDYFIKHEEKYNLKNLLEKEGITDQKIITNQKAFLKKYKTALFKNNDLTYVKRKGYSNREVITTDDDDDYVGANNDEVDSSDEDSSDEYSSEEDSSEEDSSGDDNSSDDNSNEIMDIDNNINYNAINTTLIGDEDKVKKKTAYYIDAYTCLRHFLYSIVTLGEIEN